MRSAHRVFIAAAVFALGFSAIPAFSLGYPISAVTFADANTGYLSGQYNNSPRHGFLSVTHDGGATWHATTIDGTWPTGLAVTSASRAYAVNNEGDMVITTSPSRMICCTWLPVFHHTAMCGRISSSFL